MSEKRKPHRRPSAAEMDERVAIPLDPEIAIQALMKVDLDAPEADKPKRPKKS